jgi:predicted nucleic acid-binding protein
MSARRFSLDSNLLAYFYDPRDPLKQSLAQQIVVTAAKFECMLALQSIGEFYTVVTRKKILSTSLAEQEALHLLLTFPNFPASADAHRIAAREAASGRLSYWDAVLLASASEAGCTILLSEDMKDGARLGDITVRTPFGPKGLSAAAIAALSS